MECDEVQCDIYVVDPSLALWYPYENTRLLVAQGKNFHSQLLGQNVIILV